MYMQFCYPVVTSKYFQYPVLKESVHVHPVQISRQHFNFVCYNLYVQGVGRQKITSNSTVSWDGRIKFQNTQHTVLCVCVCVCAHEQICVCVCVCMYVCMYVYIYIYIYM